MLNQYKACILHWAISYLDYLAGYFLKGVNFVLISIENSFSSWLKEAGAPRDISGCPSGLEEKLEARLAEPEVDEILPPALGTAYHTWAERLLSCPLGILRWKHHFPDLFCIALTLQCVCVCVCVCVSVHALSRSVYLTLCNPMDYSPPYSSVRGILQARILEWVAISTSRGSFQPRNRTLVSCVSYIGSRILYHHQGSLLMEQGKKKHRSRDPREEINAWQSKDSPG